MSARASRMVAITGGTGGAKFVCGLAAVLGPEDLSVIVNTGDDLECWGLHVSPDLDSITYALAGVLSRERGWGFEADTFNCLEQMRRLGQPAWFQLGDRDLALHLARTRMLREGRTLTEATRRIAESFSVRAHILPMSDDRVETRVLTGTGELGFQEYFVRERYRPAVRAVRFVGAEHARPAPGVIEAITGADAVLLAPSNPITSIGPILAVPGIREALRNTHAVLAAVSPIVSGAAVSGPAGELMRASGLAVTAEGVARAYADFLDLLIADEQDREKPGSIPGVKFVFANTLMKTDADRRALAEVALDFIGAPDRRTATG